MLESGSGTIEKAQRLRLFQPSSLFTSRYAGYAIGALVLVLQVCRSWLGTIALGFLAFMLFVGWRAERAAAATLLEQELDRYEAERRA